jgi:hypothetical protein
MDAIPSKEKVERSRKYWGVLAYAKQGWYDELTSAFSTPALSY